MFDEQQDELVSQWRDINRRQEQLDSLQHRSLPHGPWKVARKRVDLEARSVRRRANLQRMARSLITRQLEIGSVLDIDNEIERRKRIRGS